jgi:SHS2 domain-containing protein
MKYEFVDDLTSDVMFNAYGKDLKELFENSALAMFEIICDIKSVSKKKKLTIEVSANNEKNLLHNWLQQLIALVDTEELFFSDFNIVELSHDHLKAELKGESISPEKGNTVVKAVTNYKFSLEKTKNGYMATVSLDI